MKILLAGYDVLVTIDKSIPYQQRRPDIPIGIVVIRSGEVGQVIVLPPKPPTR